MQALSRVSNQIGTFHGVSRIPPAGSTKYIVTGDLPPNEVTDATNYLDIVIEASFDGTQFVEVARQS